MNSNFYTSTAYWAGPEYSDPNNTEMSLQMFDSERVYVDDFGLPDADAFRPRNGHHEPFPSQITTAQASFVPHHHGAVGVVDSYQQSAEVTAFFANVPETGRNESSMAMDVDLPSDTSSAANSPRESVSIRHDFQSMYSDDEHTPRESRTELSAAMVSRARTPRGQGKYQCPLPTCQRFYRRKGDLKVHCKKKHMDHPDLPNLISRPRSSRSGKQYLCPEPGCPCGFVRQRGLIRHYRKKHPEKTEQLDALLARHASVGGSDKARMQRRVSSLRSSMQRSSSGHSSSNDDDDMHSEEDYDGEEEEY